jgi:ribosomal protein L11 methyltransferase
MPTYSALTTLDRREDAEALSEALEAFEPEPTGIGVFEVEDGSGRFEVGAYFEQIPDDTELALLAAIYGAEMFVVSVVPDTDWVAHVRRELAPVSAGRFFVFGGHDSDRVPEGSVPLLIEASMAFGTGHHGTTKGCLLALDSLATVGWKPGQVADIGCGTAVLAMAAALVWRVPVIASDIDPVAVDVARVNVEANGLVRYVRCVEAAGFEHPDLADTEPFGLVFANILKGPLIDLAPAMKDRVALGGIAILSGILADQCTDVLAAYAGGFVLRAREDIGDWSTLVLTRGQ